MKKFPKGSRYNEFDDLVIMFIELSVIIKRENDQKYLYPLLLSTLLHSYELMIVQTVLGHFIQPLPWKPTKWIKMMTSPSVCLLAGVTFILNNKQDFKIQI